MRQIKIKMISQQIEINGDEAKHLIYSLRSKVGEKISVVDENNQRALIELVDFSKDKIIGRLIEYLPQKKSDSITLAVAIPKRGLDEIVRQATEIGVLAIQPLLTDRTVAKPSTAKQERWQRIAKEAAEQSGAFEPTIKNLISLNEFLNQSKGQLILCSEIEQEIFLNKINLAEEVTILIGCEGGFSEREFEMLKNSGALSISLGENILRVDTAAIVALSTVKFIKKFVEKFVD